MTIPVKSSEFMFGKGLPNFDLVTLAWRGACMELFVRAERDVVECLEILQTAGYKSDGKARHDAPKLRLRALRALLETAIFDNHSRPAMKRLDAWLELLDKRDWIAHGAFMIGSKMASVQHFKYKAQARVDTPAITLDLAKMMDLLGSLAKGQQELHQALGQIKAAVRRNKT